MILWFVVFGVCCLCLIALLVGLLLFVCLLWFGLFVVGWWGLIIGFVFELVFDAVSCLFVACFVLFMWFVLVGWVVGVVVFRIGVVLFDLWLWCLWFCVTCLWLRCCLCLVCCVF